MQPSPERLQQIAARKLQGWAVKVEPTPDGQRLIGAMKFTGRVIQPVSKAPIFQAPFVVHGHDRLVFTEPPLEVLGPIPFYDVESLPALETRVQKLLEARVTALANVAARFRRLHIPVVVVPDRLVIMGEVSTGDACFQLEGQPDGAILVVRMQQGRRDPIDAPRDMPPLRLEDYPASVDLELHLMSMGSRIAEVARLKSERGAATGDVAGIDLVDLPGDAPSVESVHRFFSSKARIARVEAAVDMRVGERTLRFHAVHQAGSLYKGRLVDLADPQRALWEDTVDTTRVPSVAHLAAAVLGMSIAPAPAPSSTTPMSAPRGPVFTPQAMPALRPAAPPPPMSGDVPAHLRPHPGEVWTMPVLVEKDDGAEIRYVCVDGDGRAYGAPRVLPKADFTRTFVAHGVQFHLNIRIEDVQGDTILYQQLDANKEPRGEPVRLNVHQLISVFLPEGNFY